MAHYLQFDGVDDEVTFPDVLAGAATFTINLDVNIKAAPLSFNSLLSNNNVNGGNSRNMIFTTNNRAMEVACIIGGVRRAFLTSNGIFNFNQRMMVQLQYDGATLVLRIDGVVRGSIAATGVLNTISSVGDKGFTRLGRNGSLGYPNIDLHGLEFISNGSVARFYDPSASGGVGTVLPDTSVNAINGTLVNFTVPDCWVFYGAGIDFESESSSISASQSALSTEINLASTSYSTSSSISVMVAGSINFSSISYSTSIAFSEMATQLLMLSSSRSTSASLSDLGNDTPTLNSVSYSTSFTSSDLNTAIELSSVSSSSSISYSNLTEESIARYLQRWDGLNFNSHPLERWDGAQYLRHPLMRWDGEQWVQYNG